MEKKEVVTAKAPAAIGPYSQAIVVGDFVFTSGVIPADANTGIIPSSVDEQFMRALHNLREVLVAAGSVVGGGVPIVNVRVENTSGDLRGVLYIPVDKGGKRVEKGQTIQLAPNGVDVSQSGSLLGTVRSVSQYPVTPQTMHKNLGNEQLAQWIISTQQSSVMEVNFDLVRDPGSESGYLWTSSVGEHKPITAGSFVTGSIIIERRPPIEKVFYKLSQWLRGR